MESSKNLVLVGMMGSGKTLIGKLISKQMKLRFVDIDIEIEEKEKMKIADIFKKKVKSTFANVKKKLQYHILKVKNVFYH